MFQYECPILKIIRFENDIYASVTNLGIQYALRVFNNNEGIRKNNVTRRKRVL